ncbi:hypothetical protein P5Y53_16155 [Dyella jiangningensis]|uniref:hypothetical protein n=1 Tax=Dyella jiangningensis TaxID=1379159 RepID=UPI0024100D49|nr:hypothetical protein [Dyella jiangningensis]MDG2539210.1 hypothetical protein [Dyella jiangningensis]
MEGEIYGSDPQETDVNRREFLIGSFVLWASTNVAMAGGDTRRDDATEKWLHEYVSGSTLPRLPEQVGSLGDTDRRLLRGFFDHLGDRWNLPASTTKKAAFFDDLLSMKTSTAPSYLTEYKEAAAVLLALGGAGASPSSAYERLLGPVGNAGLGAHSRLGRARQFISAEFIAWIMAKDGYARFGYQNYRGLMAGSFAIQPTPYRHL